MAKIITAIRVQQKNRERVNVFLDEQFALGLSNNLAAGLTIGQKLTQAEVELLLERDGEHKAYLLVLKLISRRPRSRQEVRSYLQKRGSSTESIERIVARLLDGNWLDDAAFAGTWVENRMAFRPRSAYALRYELRQKGIDDADIETALIGFDDKLAAEKAAAKVIKRYQKLSAELFRERLGAYLSRRGFSYATVRAVVTQVERGITGNELSEE